MINRTNTMRDGLIMHCLQSKIVNGTWHWFTTHFLQLEYGIEHPFVTSLLDTLLASEIRIPGISKHYLNAIANIEGRKKNKNDYDSLLQILAELLIVARVLAFNWEEGSTFIHEPRGSGKKKSELLVIEPNGVKILLEVKAPNYLKNSELRDQHSTQMPSRSEIRNSFNSTEITLPRDNPIKDFLISADSKFRDFQPKTDYFGVLVIVSDDFVQEVISPLVAPSSGLLTSNSFAKNKHGNILIYEHIDIIVVTRHLLNLAYCLGDKGPVDTYKHAFDYGEPFNFTSDIGFPPKVFYTNPFHNVIIPTTIHKCFQLVDPQKADQLPLGAEYIPTELIFWT